jgi:hypothetical protein
VSAEEVVQQDFSWRFLLDEKPPDESPLDPPRELLRTQWEQLLRLCVPMHGNEPVDIDGFALMRDPDRTLPIYLDDSRWSET